MRHAGQGKRPLPDGANFTQADHPSPRQRPQSSSSPEQNAIKGAVGPRCPSGTSPQCFEICNNVCMMPRVSVVIAANSSSGRSVGRPEYPRQGPHSSAAAALTSSAMPDGANTERPSERHQITRNRADLGPTASGGLSKAAFTEEALRRATDLRSGEASGAGGV